MSESRFERIYKIARCIPPGQVATYGQIARLAGMPRGARTVGWAMRATPDGSDVPWQRVVNSKGTISFHPESQGAAVQQALLEAEGIAFDEQGRIDLRLYGWPGPDPVELEEILNASPSG